MAERSSEQDIPNETWQGVEEPYRVAVCIPAQDHVATGFAYDLARLFGFTAVACIPERISHLHIFTAAGTLIAPQRQDLVLRAFEKDCTHILWVDSDMRFPKDALMQLIDRKQMIVAANYCSRRIPPRPVALSNIDDYGRTWANLYTEEDSTGLVQVEAAGTGFMLTDMRVYHIIGQPYFDIVWCEEGKGWQGEDIYFCKQARKNGIPVFVDQDLSKQIGHMGSWCFEHQHANEVRPILEREEP